jgi:hypothetical protein
VKAFGPIALLVLLGACSADDGSVASSGAGGTGASGGSSGNGSGGASGSGGAGGSAGSWPSGGSSGSSAGASGSAGAAGAGGSGGSAGGPCKTTCLGNECGFQMPDGCGSTLDCGDCGPGTDYCVVGVSEHATAVHNAHMAIQNDFPAWFDLNDMSGSNAKLLDLDSYRSELVSRMVALGKVAISDPNDNAEIRVRAATATSADNFRIVTSAGYSWDKYTSTCTPAGF